MVLHIMTLRITLGSQTTRQNQKYVKFVISSGGISTQEEICFMLGHYNILALSIDHIPCVARETYMFSKLKCQLHNNLNPFVSEAEQILELNLCDVSMCVFCCISERHFKGQYQYINFIWIIPCPRHPVFKCIYTTKFMLHTHICSGDTAGWQIPI